LEGEAEKEEGGGKSSLAAGTLRIGGGNFHMTEEKLCHHSFTLSWSIK